MEAAVHRRKRSAGNKVGAGGYRDTGTPGYRDTGIPEHRDTGTPGFGDTGIRGHRDTGTPGYGDTGIRGHRDTGIREHRDTGTPGYGDTGIREHRDTGTPGYGDTGIRGHRDTGTPGYRDTGIRGHRDTGTLSPCGALPGRCRLPGQAPAIQSGTGPKAEPSGYPTPRYPVHWMETMDVPIPIPALATEPRFAQRLREHLEAEQLLDKRYQLQEVAEGHVALPVLEEKLSLLSLPQEMPCGLVHIQDPIPSRTLRRRTPAQRLRDELRRLLGESWSEELERDVPHAWQRHGDLVLLSESSFRAAAWEQLGPVLWETVASALGARRLARRGRVLPGGMRSPSVTLLLGQDPWVEHVDNGIRYTFDVTKCMFSPGNITEKLRVASLPCTGEVLVDLYAGIGYFTLPYLVHASAAFAHACEWNSHAVEALRRNLVLNGVQDRCRVHHGDSRELQLRDVADRVNLGLLPSSEEGWPVACRVLRKATGGVLHIHHNVDALPAGSSPDAEAQHPAEGGGKEKQRARIRPEWKRWAEATALRIRGLLAELHEQSWSTSILHIEVVKSYAPHVHHLVLDLECRPALHTEPSCPSTPDPTGR